MIKLIIFDIDGILTDDTVIIDETGRELKRMNFKDVDAMFELHRIGYQLAAITGEGNAMAEYFRGRFPWDYFYSNNKQKKETVKKLSKEIAIPLEQICFVGEGKYDVEVLSYVGLGICPSDAIDRAKEASDIILKNRGGDGCVWELIRVLERYNRKDDFSSYYVDRLKLHALYYKELAANHDVIESALHIKTSMKDLLLKKKQVFLCGYEDSAASAHYMACELGAQFAEALISKRIKILDIKDTHELNEKSSAGDLFVMLFTGKLSTVIVEAIREAKKAKMVTVALTNDDIHLGHIESVDYHISIPGQLPSEVRTGHIAIWNLILGNII